MSGIFRFLFGTCVFSFDPKQKKDILNFLLEKNIGALSCTTIGNEGRLILLRKDAHKIPKELCVCISEHGAPRLLRDLLGRPGVIVGCIFAVALLVLSSMTVWRIELEGNERIGAIEIESALAEAGLSVGKLSPSLDVAAIKTQFLQENPEISWVGIYILGTTARVEVREASNEGETYAEEGFCNLVALTDGVIERISVDAGRAVVAPGTTVRAGELLISGIYKTATGLRVTRAAGSVMARSECTVTVFQPFTFEEKQYDESQTDALFLEFFGKKIKLFKKSGKTDAEYDIIKRKEQVVLFGRIALPVFFEREERLPYTLQSVSITEEEAVRMTFSRLRAEMAARFSDAEVMAEQVMAEWTDEGYRLHCRVEYVADISAPLSYDVEQNGG